MSTIKASNLQNGSSSSVNIALNTDGSATFAQMPVPSSSFLRNKLINGAMEIDQRNGGASVTIAAGGQYTLDRWNLFASQASKMTAQQNAGAVTLPTGFSNYIGITSSSAYSVGASESFSIRQYIEAFNTTDFGFGTAGAKTITLSFWVRSSLTGSFGGALYNGLGTRFYPFSYTISSANTWEQKSIIIAGDTTGTWYNGTNQTGLAVQFSLGAGASVSGASGAWTASTILQPTGSTSIVGTNGATFYLTGVQLEVGSVATPFERRLYPQELAMCQRYYQKIYVVSYQYAVGAATVYAPMAYSTMRTTPTASVLVSNLYGNTTSVTATGTGDSGGYLGINITSAGYGGGYPLISLAAEL